MTCAKAALLLVLLASTFSDFTMCGTKLIAEGLPLSERRERDVSADGVQDILSEKDFLSVLLRSSAPQTYRGYEDSEEELQSSYGRTSHLDSPNQAGSDSSTLSYDEAQDTYVRTSRDTISNPQYSYQSTETSSTNINNVVRLSTSDSSSSDSVIIAVRVSSSVDRQINKSNKIKHITETSNSNLGSSNVPLGLDDDSVNSNAQKSVIKNDYNNAQTLDSNLLESNIHNNNNNLSSEENENSEATTEQTVLKNNIFVSKNQPSLIAHASKSELSIDEAEPVTQTRENRNNRDILAIQPSTGLQSNLHPPSSYPPLLQNLPAGVNIPFNFTDFLKSNEKGSQLQPYHHSFIYHDNPQDPGRARSVSYSTLIQAVDPRQEKIISPKENQENRFDLSDGPHDDNLHQTYGVTQLSSTNSPSIVSSSTSVSLSSEQHQDSDKYNVHYESSTSRINYAKYNQWSPRYGKPLESSTFSSEFSSTPVEKSTEFDKSHQWGKFFSPSERGSLQQNPSKIYGKPEQNYEIDEAVSVHTNGRTHGIQEGVKNAPPDTTTKSNVDGKDASNKDKKTGYVVEGRNYRRYRVEEKTPDGFIVGEYGVVSNDDGSLRGVRYTADGSINPSVIYNALMKFLSL